MTNIDEQQTVTSDKPSVNRPIASTKPWSEEACLVVLSAIRGEHHVPTSLSINAKDVRYDQTTGEVFFDVAATLVVEETLGSERRVFKRDANQMVWSGSFGQQEVGSWLVRILRGPRLVPQNVAESLAKP